MIHNLFLFPIWAKWQNGRYRDGRSDIKKAECSFPLRELIYIYGVITPFTYFYYKKTLPILVLLDITLLVKDNNDCILPYNKSTARYVSLSHSMVQSIQFEFGVILPILKNVLTKR